MASKGNVSSSDLNTLFSPELAYLTGTMYKDPSTSAADEENMFRQYAPNLRLVLNLPDDNIRKIIANEIINFGSAPWDVKRQIEEYTAKQAELNPGVFNQEGETRDLMAFADTVFREGNALATQRAKGSGDDWERVTGGLPRPELDFRAEDLLPDVFQELGEAGRRARTEVGRTSVSDKTKQSALRFLEQQKDAAAQRKAAETAGRVPYPGDVPTESFLSSFRRNLANTPMGRGEAGFRGLIPLANYLYQIPAGAAALYRGINDPIDQEMKKNIQYIAQETLGSVPKPGKDVIGQLLYGKDRPTATKPTGDRAEMARFGRIAQDVVRRAEDPKRKAEASEAVKRKQWIDDFTNVLGVLAQQKARSVGYTPYQEALVARQNLLAGGYGG
jgi:hypothetical protein